MPYSPEFDTALQGGFALARDLNHAHCHLEHLLLALLDEPRAVETLRACNVDLDKLRKRLIARLDDEPLAQDGTEPEATGMLQRAIHRAGQHVEASGADKITGAHVLVAILAERGDASALLQEQGITRTAALDYVTRSIGEAPPKPPQKAKRVVVSAKGHVDLPWPEAVKELRLDRRLGGRCLWNYYETAEEEIARIESDLTMLRIYDDTPDWRQKAKRRVRRMPYVRYWQDDAVIDGDLDLDAPFDPHLIAGFAIDGNATVSGSITNWEVDTQTAFLSVVGDLACEHFVVGCSDIVVLGNVRASGVIVTTYNHGWLEINGDVHARTFIIDDDRYAVVRGDVHAAGWTSSRNAEVALRSSDWREEVRSEFIHEFFDEDGALRDGNGNVSIVKALIEGRDILKSGPRRR